ncbi:hypothetical protein Tco_0388195, partial [Tanacetum coccineum]
PILKIIKNSLKWDLLLLEEVKGVSVVKFEPRKVTEALEDGSWVEAMQEELLQFKLKLISVEKIHTDLNVADLLTKPFDGPWFNYLVVSIGMINP